jgi:polyhydroxyalkanoate synthesis regulator phasin
MKEKLERLFYFGLGSALLAKEKFDQASVSARTIKDGSDRKVHELFEEVVAKGNQEREQVKANIKEILKEAIDELGLVTRADVEALREELVRTRQGQY